MGGEPATGTRQCGWEMTRAWERPRELRPLRGRPSRSRSCAGTASASGSSRTGSATWRSSPRTTELDVDGASARARSARQAAPHASSRPRSSGSTWQPAQAAMVGDSPAGRHRGRPGAWACGVPARPRRPPPGVGGAVAGPVRAAGRAGPGRRARIADARARARQAVGVLAERHGRAPQAPRRRARRAASSSVDTGPAQTSSPSKSSSHAVERPRGEDRRQLGGQRLLVLRRTAGPRGPAARASSQSRREELRLERGDRQVAAVRVR